MKRIVVDFFKRGLIASVGGPIILAIVYLVLDKNLTGYELTFTKVAREILTVSAMAFVASGVSVIYNIERLPLFIATLIHAIVLYLDYFLIYLLNGWLPKSQKPMIVFTAVFIAAYAVIWLIVYLNIKRHVKRLNSEMKNGTH